MPTTINPRSRLENVKVTVPPEMQEYIRQLNLQIQELVNVVVAQQTQINALSRRR